MNSVATTLVTDCLRPLLKLASERKFLRLAQFITVGLGLAGTAAAISFVDPDIRSLFDQFVKVIGLFMGVLGGLFVLGAVFPRANTLGAWLGALAGTTTMFCIWQFTGIQGYLYTIVGIVTCVVVGCLGSYLGPAPQGTERLTIRSLRA